MSQREKKSITAKDILKGAAIGGAFMVPVAGLPLSLYLAKRLYGKKSTAKIEPQTDKDKKGGFKDWLLSQEQ